MFHGPCISAARSVRFHGLLANGRTPLWSRQEHPCPGYSMGFYGLLANQNPFLLEGDSSRLAGHMLGHVHHHVTNHMLLV
jgi:hypothetical protein